VPSSLLDSLRLNTSNHAGRRRGPQRSEDTRRKAGRSRPLIN
jgi:hypothetical protein